MRKKGVVVLIVIGNSRKTHFKDVPTLLWYMHKSILMGLLSDFCSYIRSSVLWLIQW